MAEYYRYRAIFWGNDGKTKFIETGAVDDCLNFLKHHVEEGDVDYAFIIDKQHSIVVISYSDGEYNPSPSVLSSISIHDVEKICNSIECDIQDDTEGCEYLNVTVMSNGFCMIVEFLGIQIWTSEDDDREYIDEEADIREPLEDYLRREIMNLIKTLNKIDL